eukprot:jgi/Mesen1/10798/ME000092S10286
MFMLYVNMVILWAQFWSSHWGLAVLVYAALVNLVSAGMFAHDKESARLGSWRVSEKALILLALVGGGFGGRWAMEKFRHKTGPAKEGFRMVHFITTSSNLVVFVALNIGGSYMGACRMR